MYLIFKVFASLLKTGYKRTDRFFSEEFFYALTNVA